MELKAYDYHVVDRIFSVLFCNGLSREDGLIEIPCASLQLVVSALEYIRWDLSGADRDTITKAISVVERLRDEQKMREWRRRSKT